MVFVECAGEGGRAERGGRQLICARGGGKEGRIHTQVAGLCLVNGAHQPAEGAPLLSSMTTCVAVNRLGSTATVDSQPAASRAVPDLHSRELAVLNASQGCDRRRMQACVVVRWPTWGCIRVARLQEYHRAASPRQPEVRAVSLMQGCDRRARVNAGLQHRNKAAPSPQACKLMPALR